MNRIVYSSILLFALFHNLIYPQAIPREEYLDYLELEYPKIINQTRASEELHLYGDISDPNYQDLDPVDGIDDKRHAILKKIAIKFSPYMVQNTTNVPIDIKAFIESRNAFPLFIDIWNIASEKPYLIHSSSINMSTIGKTFCPSNHAKGYTDNHYTVSQRYNNDDCKLLALLKEFNPKAPKNEAMISRQKDPQKRIFKIMYFDFPGEDPESWKNEFKCEFTGQLYVKYHNLLKNYVHPFILDYRKKDDTLLGYELIFQYWFFYPYNDGGNNHEGDWEHINVVVSPKNLITRNLTKSELLLVLNQPPEETDGLANELVIKRVEYYFHHNVMAFDYSHPNVYLPRDQWQEQLDQIIPERYGEKRYLEHIRFSAYMSDEEHSINTHPFVSIGGDNKGLDQVLSMPGGTNRDSHGSYPCSGLYRNIGPAGASEEITTNPDRREYLRQIQDSVVVGHSEYKRGNIIRFTSDQCIDIVPDWERVIDLVLTNREARHNWSWLILPLRWGYPATESPFSGIISHANTGNQGDIGPTFTNWWNTSMSTEGVHEIKPHIVPPIFPLGLQDSFDNSIGFFNLTYPIFFNLPPIDILYRIGVYPYKIIFNENYPVFHPEERIPFRFLAFAAGATYQKLPKEFGNLSFNKQQYKEFVNHFNDYRMYNGTDTATVVSSTSELTNPTSAVFQLAFYIGDYFASINSLRNSQSEHIIKVEFAEEIDPYTYYSEINFWEFAGSLRYNILISDLRPYLFLGYSWFWYRLENVQYNGKLFKINQTDWINKPSFNSLSSLLPNSFHLGIGLEWVIIKGFKQFPRGVDVTVRGDYGLFFQKVGVDFSHIELRKLEDIYPTLNDVPDTGTVTRQLVSLLISVGF